MEINSQIQPPFRIDSKSSSGFSFTLTCLDPNDPNDPGYSISCNFVDCIMNRERGGNRGFQNMRMTSEYATRHMLSNAMMKEYPISQSNMNKVSLSDCDD